MSKFLVTGVFHMLSKQLFSMSMIYLMAQLLIIVFLFFPLAIVHLLLIDIFRLATFSKTKIHNRFELS